MLPRAEPPAAATAAGSDASATDTPSAKVVFFVLCKSSAEFVFVFVLVVCVVCVSGWLGGWQKGREVVVVRACVCYEVMQQNLHRFLERSAAADSDISELFHAHTRHIKACIGFRNSKEIFLQSIAADIDFSVLCDFSEER